MFSLLLLVLALIPPVFDVCVGVCACVHVEATGQSCESFLKCYPSCILAKKVRLGRVCPRHEITSVPPFLAF